MGCCSSKNEGIIGPDGNFLENNEFDMEGANRGYRQSIKLKSHQNYYVGSNNLDTSNQVSFNMERDSINQNYNQGRPRGVAALPLNNIMIDNDYQESVERYNVKYKPSEL